jgi:hypothetical protein
MVLALAAGAVGQEMVTGGNMEDEGAWNVYDMGSTDPSDYQFNYTADCPAAGNGGCLYVTGTSGYTNILFWQALTLTAGVTYELHAAFKEISGDATLGNWVQFYMSTEEPVEGVDYKPPGGANSDRLTGFNSWVDQTWSGLDGTFEVDGLEKDDGGKTKYYTPPGAEGEQVTVYLGLKTGVWGNSPIFYEILVDEISLKPKGQFDAGPVFPPVAVTGPFPYGTEPKRDDSPVDATRPSDIVHEYTAYKVTAPPVIDGEIDNDPVWNQIPWTVMTFWENSGYTEEFSIFDGQTSDLWDGFTDCTAWWKLLWDADNVYLAIRVIDDQYNPPADPANPGNMHGQDCIQFGIHTTPPGEDVPVDGDIGCELGFGITDANGAFEELFANWNWSGHPWANAEMFMTDGDNASGNASTDGKAIHASVEETDAYFIYRFEVALMLDANWAGFIDDNVVNRVTIMAMDHDTGTYEDVNWASGILTKDFTRLGSVLWSPNPPVSTAVEGREAQIPVAFSLGQNYPNPFNPTTALEYTLPREAAVTVTVVNLRGEEVLRVLDGVRQSAGPHRLTVDASSLGSGVYVCRVQAGQASASVKMTLVK